VSARDDAGDWRILTVYDDGWCETPAPTRTPAETRRRLRELLGWMAALVGLFAAAAAAAVLLPSAIWVSYVLLAGSAAVVVAAAVRAVAVRARGRAPDFASSAEQAAASDDVRRVALPDVRSVTVERAGHEDVVTVTVRRGRPMAYRSPDRTLGRLFQPWSPMPR
jgi:hypothetical protein